MNGTEERFQQEQPFLRTLGDCLSQQLMQGGLPRLAINILKPTTQEIRIDPFDKSEAWCAQWRTDSGQLLGQITVQGNGQCFAEFDVLSEHPKRSGWFVEAVTAWGDKQRLKSELRLLPAMSDA